jgi:hypothetical protein
MWNLFNLIFTKTKFPSHILLDWQSSCLATSSQYWFLKHLLIRNSTSERVTFFNFIFKKKFNFKNSDFTSTFLLRNAHTLTLKYRGSSDAIFLTFRDFRLKSFFKANAGTVKSKKTNFVPSLEKEIYEYTSLSKKKIIKRKTNKFFKNFSLNNTPTSFENNNLWSLFDINFLKKEKMYTKLKYSRVPQYDIVSGGVAALFAGFLGFLICEKFGFELLDSGDFYILFMYIVFISFFLKLFSNLFTHNRQSWSGFSVKWFFFFYKNIFFLLLKKLPSLNFFSK